MTDSLPGIRQCVNDALADAAQPPVALAAIRSRVGTPPRAGTSTV